MPSCKSLAVLLLAAIAAASNSAAAVAPSNHTVYVSPSGDDAANSGLLPSAPLRTLTAAQLLLRSLLRTARAESELGATRSDPCVFTVIVGPGQYFNSSLRFTNLDGAPSAGCRVVWKGEAHANADADARTANAPDTIDTADAAEPLSRRLLRTTNASTVYGGARVVGWSVWAGMIWRARLPAGLSDSSGRATFHTLVQGERRAWNARSPNAGSGYLNCTAYDQDGFNWAEGALPSDIDCNSSRCSVFTRAGYSSDIRGVLSINRTSPKGGRVTYLPAPNGSDPGIGSLYISGALELLDEAGEWAVRGGWLYYWPWPHEQMGDGVRVEARNGAQGANSDRRGGGERKSGLSNAPNNDPTTTRVGPPMPTDPNTMIITAPATQRLISVVGSSRFNRVQGLELVGLRLVGSDMPYVYTFSCETNPQYGGERCRGRPGYPDGPDEQNTTPLEAAQGMVFIENASHIAVKDCALMAAGIAAVWLQEAASDVVVSGNWVQDMGGFGVYANGVVPGDKRYDNATDADVNRGHTITGNLFWDGGKRIAYGSGVWLYQSGSATITHNVIAQFPRDCVGFYGVLPLWTADPDGPVAPGRPPTNSSMRRPWGRPVTWNGGMVGGGSGVGDSGDRRDGGGLGDVGGNLRVQGGSRDGAGEESYRTRDVLYTRDNYLAFNDCSLCNRRGMDGGVIESWGVGDNNTWEHNAVHDNEGFGGLSLFFADDFSPGLTVRANIAFENSCTTRGFSNCAVFMMKSINNTVESNIVADCNMSRVFEVSQVSLPAANLRIAHNILWNTTQRTLVVSGPRCEDGIVQHSACDSYYALRACDPNRFGHGVGFPNATMAESLEAKKEDVTDLEETAVGETKGVVEAGMVPWNTSNAGEMVQEERWAARRRGGMTTRRRGGDTTSHGTTSDTALNIDGLSMWIGSTEGPCIPSGDLLVKEGGATVAKVAFKNAPEWFVAPIDLGNAFGVAENLSTTPSFTIVYTAESDFWMQMRSKSHWSGGSQWATRLAAGVNVSHTVQWANSSAWETPLGKPAQTLAQVLSEAQGMIMVGNTNNALTVRSLTIPGFTPPPSFPSPVVPTPPTPTLRSATWNESVVSGGDTADNSTADDTFASTEGYSPRYDDQRQLLAQYGFDPSQLSAPVVAMADNNFVSDARLLHKGACLQWDTNTLELSARPFDAVDGTPRPWHSRTALDYNIPPTSPLVTQHGFGGSFDPRRIGLGGMPGDGFRFDLAPFKRRSAYGRIDAERYDRTKNLWTVEGQALGTSPHHFNNEVFEGIPPGSWARFDKVDFGPARGAGGAVGAVGAVVAAAVASVRPGEGADANSVAKDSRVGVRVYARSEFDGATVRFQLDSPGASGRLIDTVVIGTGTAAVNSTGSGGGSGGNSGGVRVADIEPSLSGFTMFEGTGGGKGVRPVGVVTVFMVFEEQPPGRGSRGRDEGSTVHRSTHQMIGGAVDYFTFVTL